MKSTISFRSFLFLMLMTTTATTYAQSNTEKIKAKWSVERFEIEKNTPQAVNAQQQLQGAFLTFGDEELVISKKTEAGEAVLNKGPYFISENSVTLGKDRADILLLSEKQLTIKIPNQGILYLSKM